MSVVPTRVLLGVVAANFDGVDHLYDDLAVLCDSTVYLLKGVGDGTFSDFQHVQCLHRKIQLWEFRHRRRADQQLPQLCRPGDQQRG